MQKPIILYKYFSPEALEKILNNNSIKMESLQNYNDVMEMYPAYEGVKIPFVSPMDINERLKRLSFLNNFSEIDIFNYHLEENFECYGINYSGKMGQKEQLALFNKPETFIAMADYIRRCTLCSCFSQNPLVDLMWAHYAKSHTGICLGFSTNLFENKLTKVKYKKRRIDVGFSSKNNYLSGTKEVAYTKGRQWIYEQEWRFMHCFNIPIEIIDGSKIAQQGFEKHIINNTSIFLKPFSWYNLKEVYYGIRTDQSLITKLNNKLKQNDNIQYYQIVPHSYNFTLKGIKANRN